MASALETLMELRDDPYSRARAWKERTGGSVVGFFCCYAPEELLHAAGALPVRVTGENRTVSKAGAHLQSYCCSLARTALDMALTGDLDFLDGTVFVHTCDTMQRLSDIWRLNAGYPFHVDFALPVRFEGKLAAEYTRAELGLVRSKLAHALGQFDDDAIRESIRVYNRNRALLTELYDLRRADPGIMPCDQAVWVVASAALMDKAEHNEILEEILSDLRGASGRSDRIRLFGVGSVMDQWEFLGMLEDLGGTFADDDFCTGHRYFEGDVSEEGDPLDALTGRLMERGQCACKHTPDRERSARIVQRARACGARGAIFFQFKFCEPHGFDYPAIKKALDEAGFATLELEMEQGSVSIEQLRTRVEALLETIRG
ncbi:MAG: 2-hydroxyacyl-CoA dehydratase family protein [Actinobacteria bacterium]|nr:2-hydroxyacyl-CoA dehydratase family protein [Actinomycetota bacterium]MBU1943181.1 2-hydroxyacyl-CoA dehydratase family protein [Actinomycetota bacterium]MBU2687859.1 2-hydroxyacyl-CoA dehydratase family protein [Actinomycetota bacterium]